MGLPVNVRHLRVWLQQGGKEQDGRGSLGHSWTWRAHQGYLPFMEWASLLASSAKISKGQSSSEQVREVDRGNQGLYHVSLQRPECLFGFQAQECHWHGDRSWCLHPDPLCSKFLYSL